MTKLVTCDYITTYEIQSCYGSKLGLFTYPKCQLGINMKAAIIKSHFVHLVNYELISRTKKELGDRKSKFDLLDFINKEPKF